MSQVLLVRLDDPVEENRYKAILKIYGRRFMSTSRRYYKQSEWSPSLERLYRKFALQHPRSQPDFPRPEDGQLEVYRRLSELQGKDVPRLYGRIELLDTYHSHDPFQMGPSPRPLNGFSDILSGLLQYIPNAFTLQDIWKEDIPPAPREAWQYIIDDAVRIVCLIRDREIINRDARPWNILVYWDAVTSMYKVFAIDFAMCEICKDELELQWRKKQVWSNEEDAIGEFMEARLKRNQGGGYEFTRSGYSKQLLEEFQYLFND
ncbi:hypothetical protein BDN70DRAFT_995966 [Pholiota conissans]|uniref:Protein kinase domain-containing protein n=1 Tax=Pholiota conissans TaxID=109636 RepID=A0A9P6CRD5_9AGAR|nr:hypothetical protein BDN70DRAFT_995966 [Pholiota conissans]